MRSELKLTLGFVAFIIADLGLIAGMYMHGKMHLIKTLQAAIAAHS